MKNESMQIARNDLGRASFFVCVDGGEPIGPVSATQIAKGIVAGKVPREAYVAREGDPDWAEVLDTPEVYEALKCL